MVVDSSSQQAGKKAALHRSRRDVRIHPPSPAWLTPWVIGCMSGIIFGSSWHLFSLSLSSCDDGDNRIINKQRLEFDMMTHQQQQPLQASDTISTFDSVGLSNHQGDASTKSDIDTAVVVAPTNIRNSNSKMNVLQGSLAKLRKQWSPQEINNFNRSNPIYIDIGMSDGADTKHHLSQGYSVVSVDAFLPWIEQGKNDFVKEIADHQLLLFNVGVGVEESASMPLYYKEAGSVISSFVKEKGCQNYIRQGRECLHTDVPVVRCEAVLELIGVQAHLLKVDVEMMHHSCVRSLHHVETALLPRYVCWEEHDKPLNQAAVRPITDTKLILGMFELGYSEVKIVMQGPKAARFYGIKRSEAGFGQGSGTQTPEEMMHYRSYEDHGDTGEFDTEWRTVDKVLHQGIFGPGGAPKAKEMFYGNSYYDICMKLSPNAGRDRTLRSDPQSFPLASYASSL